MARDTDSAAALSRGQREALRMLRLARATDPSLLTDGPAYQSLRVELATIFGPVQPREGQTWNEAMLARITERLVADGI